MTDSVDLHHSPFYLSPSPQSPVPATHIFHITSHHVPHASSAEIYPHLLHSCRPHPHPHPHLHLRHPLSVPFQSTTPPFLAAPYQLLLRSTLCSHHRLLFTPPGLRSPPTSRSPLPLSSRAPPSTPLPLPAQRLSGAARPFLGSRMHSSPSATARDERQTQAQRQRVQLALAASFRTCVMDGGWRRC